jgi:alpha-L-fucosidase
MKRHIELLVLTGLNNQPMKILLLPVLIAFTLTTMAQSYTTDEELLKQFQDMKFGMFVHWGPVSLKGTEIGWSRGKEVPSDEYDNLYKDFNPVRFNADEWIKTLKDAGMKYFIITSRHHDGFSLWPTAYSEYNIMATQYKKDVLMEMKQACDKHGILFGTYYSICDWKHPLYPLGSPGGSTRKETGDMEKFLPLIQEQTRELIEKYNSRIMWFDGEWEEPWTHEMGQDFYQYLKSVNENILINNRVDKGRKGMEGTTISDQYAGDFATPEQRIGTYNIDQPWESCITICTQWSWKPDDKLKSTEECLQTLLKTVGGGGNLLLNVGPMPDGRIEPRQADRLREMGAWLKKYGEAVYGTTGGPYKPHDRLASARKDNTVFIYLFNSDKDILELPFPDDIRINDCSVLKGKKLTFNQEAGTLRITLPEKRNEIVTVLKLNLNQQAETLGTLEI